MAMEFLLYLQWRLVSWCFESDEKVTAYASSSSWETSWTPSWQGKDGRGEKRLGVLFVERLRVDLWGWCDLQTILKRKKSKHAPTTKKGNSKPKETMSSLRRHWLIDNTSSKTWTSKLWPIQDISVYIQEVGMKMSVMKRQFLSKLSREPN